MAEYVYIETKWLNDIIELDEFNRPVTLKDEQGNILYETDLNGIIVLHPITKEPIPKYRRLQHGTGHSAGRDNNQEQGIAMSHQRLDDIDVWRTKKDIRDDIDDKSPGNAGSFADAFDGEPIRIKRETAAATITTPVAAGTTVLPVDNVADFVPFTEVTIFDGTSTEDVLITAIGVDTITVQALTHDYVKGAQIARSNAWIADGQMGNGSWGTYIVMEVV